MVKSGEARTCPFTRGSRSTLARASSMAPVAPSCAARCHGASRRRYPPRPPQNHASGLAMNERTRNMSVCLTIAARSSGSPRAPTQIRSHPPAYDGSRLGSQSGWPWPSAGGRCRTDLSAELVLAASLAALTRRRSLVRTQYRPRSVCPCQEANTPLQVLSMSGCRATEGATAPSRSKPEGHQAHEPAHHR